MTHHHMHGMQACFDPSDRYADTKRAIADLAECLHRGRTVPPTLEELTEAGAQAVRDTHPMRNEHESRLLDYLGEEDVRRPIRIMGRLAEYRER